MSQTGDIPGSKNSTDLRKSFLERQFTTSLMNLKLRMAEKKEDMKAEESKAGLEYRILSKIKCSFEGGFTWV